MSADFRELLRDFNLSKSEAQAYVLLMEKGSMAASDLARLAHIPQPRIYSVLHDLAEKGFLREVSKKPATYDAMNPGHIVRSKLSELRSKVEAELAQAEQVFETRLQTAKPVMYSAWISYGKGARVAEILNMLTNSKEAFIGVFKSLDWVTEEGILKLLKQKARSNLGIKVIGLEIPATLEDLEILQDATGAQVRTLPEDPYAIPFAVMDNLRLLVELDEGSSGMRQTISIVTNDARLGNHYAQEFERLWSTAESVKSR